MAGNQTISLRFFLIPTIIASLIFFGYLFFEERTQIPLVGSLSIANFVLSLGVASGVCSFLFVFIEGKYHKIQTRSQGIYWRNFPTILISFIIILVFALLLFSKSLDSFLLVHHLINIQQRCCFLFLWLWLITL